MKLSKKYLWEFVSESYEHILTNLDSMLSYSITDFVSTHPKTIFDSKTVARISIHDYLQRLYKYFDCSDSCYIISFIYIDRIISLNPGFMITRLNIHKLILISLILAVKYNDDQYGDNSYYSKVGGIIDQELNELENGMLDLLQFNLFIDVNEYFQYLRKIKLCTQGINMLHPDSKRKEESLIVEEMELD